MVAEGVEDEGREVFLESEIIHFARRRLCSRIVTNYAPKVARISNYYPPRGLTWIAQKSRINRSIFELPLEKRGNSPFFGRGWSKQSTHLPRIFRAPPTTARRYAVTQREERRITNDKEKQARDTRSRRETQRHDRILFALARPADTLRAARSGKRGSGESDDDRPRRVQQLVTALRAR